MRKPRPVARRKAPSGAHLRRDVLPPEVPTVSTGTETRPPDPEQERPEDDEAIRRMVEAAYT